MSLVHVLSFRTSTKCCLDEERSRKGQMMFSSVFTSLLNKNKLHQLTLIHYVEVTTTELTELRHVWNVNNHLSDGRIDSSILPFLFLTHSSSFSDWLAFLMTCLTKKRTRCPFNENIVSRITCMSSLTCQLRPARAHATLQTLTRICKLGTQTCRINCFCY